MVQNLSVVHFSRGFSFSSDKTGKKRCKVQSGSNSAYKCLNITKKGFLAVLAIVTFSFINAQEGGFEKGDILISGSFGYFTQSSDDIKTIVYEVTPRVGFFVSDHIAVGARIGYINQKRESSVFEDFKSNIFTGGAFGRYYFKPSNKFSIFGEFSANYFSGNTEIERIDSTVDSTTDGFSLDVGPGISYFLSNNFALEAFWGALSYSSTKFDSPEEDTNNVFSIGADLNNINLGLVYKF